jgi:hypothetical protein
MSFSEKVDDKRSEEDGEIMVDFNKYKNGKESSKITLSGTCQTMKQKETRISRVQKERRSRQLR